MTDENNSPAPKILLKVPKNLFSLSPKEVKLYAAYLDFKLFNPEGVIQLPFARKADRGYYSYWLRKLVAKGWVSLMGSKYSLRSYQEVWKSMGVHQPWNVDVQKYRYAYVQIACDNLSFERKLYRNQIIEFIRNRIAGNKVRQIKWRLKNRQTPAMAKTETFMSSRAVAKLFGYKSSSSGHKTRQKYFNVIPEPLVTIKTIDGYRKLCKKIAI